MSDLLLPYFIAHHDDRIADLKRRMHDALPIQPGHRIQNFRAEGLADPKSKTQAVIGANSNRGRMRSALKICHK